MSDKTTSEELRRLAALPPRELLKEFNKARERLRGYLEDKGIDVPDFEAASVTDSASASSILLDEFSVDAIKSIDASVTTIYSTASALNALLQDHAENGALKSILVKLDDGSTKSAGELVALVESDDLQADAQITLDSQSLKEAITAPTPVTEKIDRDDVVTEDGWAAGEEDEIPVEVDAAVTEATEEPAIESVSEEATAEKAGGAVGEPEGPAAAEAGELQELSPVISQEEYDSLIGGAQVAGTAVDTMPESQVEAVPEEMGTEEDTISQDEMDALFDDQAEGGTELSQDELDALFEEKEEDTKAEEESTELSQDELDALFEEKEEDTKAEEESTELSQDELDALFEGKNSDSSDQSASELTVQSTEERGKETPVPEEDGDTELSQDELDALFASKDDGAELSQDELDALFESPSAEVAEPEETVSESVEDNRGDKAGELLEGKDDGAEISQGELDAIFEAKAAPEPVAVTDGAAAPEEVEDISQDELDALFASDEKSSDVDLVDGEVSQDELDALFSGNLGQ